MWFFLDDVLPIFLLHTFLRIVAIFLIRHFRKSLSQYKHEQSIRDTLAFMLITPTVIIYTRSARFRYNLFMAKPEDTPSILDVLPPDHTLRILVMVTVITLRLFAMVLKRLQGKMRKNGVSIMRICEKSKHVY